MKNEQYSGAYSRRRFSNYSSDDSNLSAITGTFTLSVSSANTDMGTAGAIKLLGIGSQTLDPSHKVETLRGRTVYPVGTRFRAVATPRAGYRFISWTANIGGGNITANPYEFTLEQNVTLVANFAKIEEGQENKTLKVSWNGTMGRVNCNARTFVYGNESPVSSGSITATADTSVTLSAEPKAGYHFVRWNGLNIGGNAQNNESPSITINVRTATLTAVFEADNAGGGGENPGNGGENPGVGGDPEHPYPEIGGGSLTASLGTDSIVALLKKWWWVLLIAYVVYKETKGGSK